MKTCLLCVTLATLFCAVPYAFAEDSALTIGPRRENAVSREQMERDSAERIQAHMRESRKKYGENVYIQGSWILDDTNYVLITGFGRKIERQYYGQRVRVESHGTGGNGINTEVLTITDLKSGKVLESMKFEDKIPN